MSDDLLIVSRRWASNRGALTSVERFCQLLKPQTTISGENFLKNSVSRRLKKVSNAKRFNDLTPPYSSESLNNELRAIAKLFKSRHSVCFYPYADYDYFLIRYFKKVLRTKIVLYSFFSISELENRFKNLDHFKHADVLLVASMTEYEYLRERLKGSKVIVKYFPLGVDTDFFRPGNSYSKFDIVQAGLNRRDFDTLFKAFDLLSADMPEVKLNLVGCSKVKEIPQRDYIINHKFLNDDDLVKLYQKCNLMVLPLLDYASSNSLNEGLASGLPVITNDLNNFKYYSQHLVSFESHNEYDLYEKCKHLINNKIERDQLSQKVREDSMAFSWTARVAEFNEICAGL